MSKNKSIMLSLLLASSLGLAACGTGQTNADQISISSEETSEVAEESADTSESTETTEATESAETTEETPSEEAVSQVDTPSQVEESELQDEQDLQDSSGIEFEDYLGTYHGEFDSSTVVLELLSDEIRVGYQNSEYWPERIDSAEVDGDVLTLHTTTIETHDQPGGEQRVTEYILGEEDGTKTITTNGVTYYYVEGQTY